MSPVRYAMRLVNDEKTDVLLKSRQHLTTKLSIRQPFRRNQQDVALVLGNRRVRLLPLVPFSLWIVIGRNPMLRAASIWFRISASSGLISSAGPELRSRR